MEKVQSQFIQVATPDQPLVLLNGESLSEVTLAYEAYGELNAAKDNAILLFHALSGSQHAAGDNQQVEAAGASGRFWTEDCQTGWWHDFVGPGKALDTSRFFVICANYLGGCYGSTGPASLDPATGQPYGSRFPSIAISDIVDTQARLLDALGIERVHAVVGGSMGGMNCVAFAVRYPNRVSVVIPMATSFYATTLHRINNFEQICAIECDAHFKGGDYYDGPYPEQGLALARMIAHKNYVSLSTMEDRARDEVIQPSVDWFKHYRFSQPIESYLLHQGLKFVRRFDANTYIRLCEAWLRFDLLEASGKQDIASMMEACSHQKYMIFSVDSDVCFYPEEQVQMARMLKDHGVDCRHITIHSEKGHDAFLLEADLLEPHIKHSLQTSW